ncbi:MAG: outer membrane beta-barrel protein [Verrucomicrobia bacterium]|nr:outer membrane beta-barrel protein [Verrucomicrobiota bacterium]
MSLPKHHLTTCRAFPGRALARWFGIVGMLFFLSNPGFGQEALRTSLAGEYALEAQKREVENQNYNLKMGDLKLRFQTALDVEATDNVNYTDKNRQADISLRPEIDVTAVMPVTDKNTLVLNLGGGYAKYAKTKTRDHFFLTPDSTVSFKVYTGDFVFDLHTQFNYTQDSYQQTSVNGGNYGYFDTLAGISATWDLNKLVFTFSYDHDIYAPTETQYAYQGRASELLNARAVFLLNPTTQLGLQIGASATTFDTKPGYTNVVNSLPIGTNTFYFTNTVPAYTFLSNQKSVNFGPYFQSGLSPHLRVTFSAGYALFFQENDSSYAKATDSAAFYADLMVQHTVNAYLGYSLNIGHQVRQGLAEDGDVESYYLHLSPTWRASDKLTIQTPLSLESYTAMAGKTEREKYQYLTLGLSATYRLSSKLNLTGSYNYRRRDSNIAGNGFTENELVLDTRYSF